MQGKTTTLDKIVILLFYLVKILPTTKLNPHRFPVTAPPLPSKPKLNLTKPCMNLEDLLTEIRIK